MNVQMAWLTYAGKIAMGRENGAVGPDFNTECRARDAMAKLWEARARQAGLREPYLDLLARVRTAGFMREYVWQYLRRSDWPQPPDLEQEAFKAWWVGRGLGEHKAVTWVFFTPVHLRPTCSLG